MMASNASCCKILFRAGSLFSFLSFSRFPSPLYLSLICFLRCLSVCLSTSLFSLCDLRISPAIHQSVYLIYLPIHIHILLNIYSYTFPSFILSYPLLVVVVVFYPIPCVYSFMRFSFIRFFSYPLFPVFFHITLFFHLLFISYLFITSLPP